MINLHKRMLPDPAGIEPATSCHLSEAHPTEPPRPALRISPLFAESSGGKLLVFSFVLYRKKKQQKKKKKKKNTDFLFLPKSYEHSCLKLFLNGPEAVFKTTKLMFKS